MLTSMVVAALLTTNTPLADASRRPYDWPDARSTQLRERVPNETERRWLLGCMAVNLFGATLDAASTIQASRLANTRELSVVLAPGFRAKNDAAIWGWKLGIAGVTNLIYYLIADTHPRHAAAVACGTGVLGVTAGILNKKLIRDIKRKQRGT